MVSSFIELNENSNLSTFLKEQNQSGKNYYFIILIGNNNKEKPSYVDIRTVGTNISKNIDVKLKSLKRPFSLSDTNDSKENLLFLLNSGERIIKAKDEFYDFTDALETAIENEYEFLKNSIMNFKRDDKELYFLSEDDKISTAKNLFSKYKLNLIPVLDDMNKVIGEIRNFELIRYEFFLIEKRKSSYNKKKSDNTAGMMGKGSMGQYYDEDYKKSIHNLPVSSIMFKTPKTVNSSDSIKDAVDIMIKNKLPSVIVIEDEKIHSIITYKDILKKIKDEMKIEKYTIEFQDADELFEDEFEMIKDFAKTSMDKITERSNYKKLHVKFKTHGNIEGSHRRKFSIFLNLSHGNKVLTSHKKVLGRTEIDDEEVLGEKVKERWNIPKMFQNALTALEKKVYDEKDKIRDNRRGG